MYLEKVCFLRSGKSTTAGSLAKRYDAALLTLDGVIIDAIASGSTTQALRVRDMCAEVARRAAEELRQVDSVVEEVDKKPIGGGNLSVEALTAHTQGAGKDLSLTSHSFINEFDNLTKLIQLYRPHTWSIVVILLSQYKLL